jgi:nicotinamidase-related amidase
MKFISALSFIFLILFISCDSFQSVSKPKSALVIVDALRTGPKGGSFCLEQLDNMIVRLNKLIDAFSAKDMDVIYFTMGIVPLDKRLKVTGDLQYVKPGMSAFSDKKFVQHLKSKNITKLYFGGMAAEACVSSSAVDAVKEGYSTVIISDCMAAFSCDHLQNAIEYMTERGAKVISSGELMKEL